MTTNKTKNIARIAALFLCITMLFTSCSMPEVYLPFNIPGFSNNSGGGSGKVAPLGGRRTIPYTEMEYKRPDVEALKQTINGLIEDAKTADSFSDIQKLENEFGTDFEEFSTMSSLAQLKTYQNVNDTYFEEEFRFIEEHSADISTLVNQYIRVIVEGPYANDYREWVGDYYFQSLLDMLLLDSPEVTDLKKQRNLLAADYNKLISTITIADDTGKEYTMDDIFYIEDYDTRIDLYSQFLEINSPQFAAIYLEMIQLDKQTSEILGFETAADMYYLSYTRDYTPAQAMDYMQEIKSIFTPMAEDILSIEAPYIPADYDKTFETMPAVMGEIDPQLEKVWNFMMKYELSDFEYDKNKQQNVAFTTYIQGYDAPFCYGSWAGGIDSVREVTHEFGHFYDMWLRYNVPIVPTLDIQEAYSQGMEILLQPHYSSFTKKANDAKQDGLNSFFSALLMQSFLEEFQQEIFAAENPTHETIVELFGSLSEEYGLGEYFGEEMAYRWYTISHIFDSPFYTISYVTSGVVSLQIWDISEQDYQAAVDTYMNMMYSDQNLPFTEIVLNAGLRNPMDTEVLEDIADQFARYYELTPLPRAA